MNWLWWLDVRWVPVRGGGDLDRPSRAASEAIRRLKWLAVAAENGGKGRHTFFTPHFPGVGILGQGHNQSQRQDSRQQRYTERTYGNRYIPCHSKVPFLRV